MKPRSPRQETLFDLGEARGRFQKPPPSTPPPSEDFSRQLPLFADRILKFGELEEALGEADYRKALEVTKELERTYGTGAVPPRLSYVNRLGADFWERPMQAAERLSAWKTIAQELEAGTRSFARARKAFFRRLLSMESPDHLIRCDPESLSLIANALYELEDVREGRRVVRDALLSGYGCRPADLADEALSDLLSEDLDPPWLACLGAIRRLWSPPRPGPEDLDGFEEEIQAPLPLNDEERALSFWKCLRIARLGPFLTEPMLHEARKRMKKLNAELHAEFMSPRGVLGPH
jgi:hypothetical protein